MSKTNPTYYDILELSSPTTPRSDVTSLDIKKAYRRLALQYHPDRNAGPNQEACKVKFQHIGHAYEVLSDERRRKEYDGLLDRGMEVDADGAVVGTTGTSSSGAGAGTAYSTTTPFGGRPSYTYANPYSVFDDLFRNDPFFADAFRDMDDEFARRFQQKKQNAGGETDAGGGNAKEESSFNNMCTSLLSLPQTIKSKGGVGRWLLDKMGVQVTVSSYRTEMDGTVSASTYTNTGTPGTYTDKKTRTYVNDEGERVTIKSMERDGNRIEDMYVDNELRERKVNGKVEPLKSGTIADSR